MSAAAPVTSKTFKGMLANCEEVVKTHDPTQPVGSRKYLARDFSIVTEAGKMANITELLFEFQSRLHVFKAKKESEVVEAWTAIRKTIGHFQDLSESGVQQKLFRFRKVFEVLIVDKARHSLAVYLKPQNVVSVLGEKPTIKLFEACSVLMSTSIALKEFAYICSQFVKITFDNFESISKLSESNKEKPFSLKDITIEGMAFLIRWFRITPQKRIFPKKFLTTEEEEKFKLFLKDTTPEIRLFAKNFLFTSKFLKDDLIWKQHRALLQNGFKFAKDLLQTEFAILQPYQKLISFLSEKEGWMNSEFNENVVAFAKELESLVDSELSPHEASINTYYEYLERELKLYLSLKSKTIKPKKLYGSLIGLNHQKDFYTSELFRRISVQYTKESAALITRNEKMMLEILNDSVAQKTSPIQVLNGTEADEKDGKHKSSSQTGIGYASTETAAQGTATGTAGASATATALNFTAAAAEAILAATATASTTTKADAKSAKESTPIEVVRAQRAFKHGIKYLKNVREWFTHPLEAIKKPKYAELPPKVQNKIRVLHTFPLCVDQFVGSEYCRKKVVTNEHGKILETQYRLPVQVTMGEETVFAVVEYTMNPEGRCFHRCISEQEAGTFFHTWANYNFPDMDTSTKVVDNAAEVVVDDGNVAITFEPGLECFVIESKAMTIKLMKVGEE
jgi:hypothetical protein